MSNGPGGARGAETAALVLTHNAPASLGRCLHAIDAQSDPPATVLVVDNASDPPVEASSFSLSIPVRVLRSDTNLGPAGGWALAFTEFMSGGLDHAWVMDDDMVPEHDCLTKLWAKASKHDEPAFVFPLAEQRDGTLAQWGSWCGFLIAKEIVTEVGVPNADFFWWAEDTEYCHWRIPQAGHPRRVARQARVRHDGIRQGDSVPTWKYYYETRNMIYLHLHVMHRVGWFPRNFTKLMGRALVRERRDHLRRAVAIWRGAWDGILGRLGPRYPVSPLRERPAN